MAEDSERPADVDDSNGIDDSDEIDDGDGTELPPALVDEVERLTRRARESVDDGEGAACRDARAELLADTEFTARMREGDRDVLVLYPEEWVVDGTVRPDQVDDVDRGIERPLEGPGSAENWESVEERNRAVAERVAEKRDAPHGENAHALADFASNHYAKPIGDLTPEERAEFLTEYFPRNGFPSEEQEEVVEESIEIAVGAAESATDTR